MAASLWVALAFLGGARAEADRFLPDPAFGTNGVLDLLPGNGTGGVFHEVTGVQPGPEGGVYVLYRQLPSPEMYECEAPRFLGRLLSDGGLDSGFGDHGFVSVATPVGCEYPRLAVDDQHRPLLTWTSVGTLRAPSSLLAMSRYTLEGRPDPSFGSNGVATLQIPCPGGNGAGARGDRRGRLILSFGCRQDESPEGLASSTFRSFLARLQPNGALDSSFGARFGASGIITLPQEPGWESPVVSAAERDGSLILYQTTDYVEGVPERTRLLRLRPDGTLDATYRRRAERALRRVAALSSPQAPEEPTDFALHASNGLVVSGRGNHNGWVIALRHNGSLDPGFSHDGYRRFATPIRFIAADRHGRLLVLGREYSRGFTIYRLQPDGDRDRSVGGPMGEHVAGSRTESLADLVSLRHDRPLLYFNNLRTDCTSPEACTEPAELRRFRLFPKG